MIYHFLHKSILLFLLLFTLSINLIAQTETNLTLLSPNGGEHWTTGSFPRITWKSTNILVIKIDISFDAGLSWQSISPAAVAAYGSYSTWQIGSNVESNNCLIKISKYDDPNVYDVSELTFSIVTDTTTHTLVVLGSSTAAGVGPSSLDSAWVNRFRHYLFEKNTTIKVVNLAVGGYTTYDIMPTGFITPANRPTPKIANNISKAVTYNPEAIIINLPSNDVNMGYSITEQLSNYDTILTLVKANNIPVWVSTTQPRNFSVAQIQLQIEMRDSTFARFGDKSIDFWTDIADSNGRINPDYNSGDGIHLNAKAHAILFSRVKEAEIFNPMVTKAEGITFTVSSFELMQNYPNPFNPSTKISFSISEGGQYFLKISNVLGQEVKTLLYNYLTPGSYKLNFDAEGLASGIYIYRLLGNDKVLSKKMILIK